MTKGYSVNGVTVLTLKEVAEELEVSRVTGKDILEGKYPEVEVINTSDVEGTEEVAVTDIEEEDEAIVTMEQANDALREAGIPTDEEEAMDFIDDHVEVILVGDAPTEALTNSEEVEEDIEEVEEPTEEVEESDTEYPEIGYFEDEKAMKKYIKKLSNEELHDWCELEGAEYNPNDHTAINRMRQAMAIKALHFPDTAPKSGKSKSRSKYADYTTEDLVQMAIDNNVEIKDDKGDMRILRMYTIMALREAGLIS